jgi:hypothetical protein
MEYNIDPRIYVIHYSATYGMCRAIERILDSSYTVVRGYDINEKMHSLDQFSTDILEVDEVFINVLSFEHNLSHSDLRRRIEVCMLNSKRLNIYCPYATVNYCHKCIHGLYIKSIKAYLRDNRHNRVIEEDVLDEMRVIHIWDLLKCS